MTTAPSHTRPTPPRQSGAVLFVALVFLLILTLLGVMLARTQTTEERMAQNDGNHELAVEAAEAALRYAESNISEGLYVNFAGDTNGLYQLNPAVGSVYTPGSASFWTTANSAISYGGASLASVSTAPQFIVEQLPAVADGGDSLGLGGGYGTSTNLNVYQITAHASGGDQTGTATLRSIYQVEQ
ncbi:MAG: PilX N-terminal domain-containing pilus assembly protein [Steroidobacteraceae bacterium]